MNKLAQALVLSLALGTAGAACDKKESPLTPEETAVTQKYRQLIETELRKNPEDSEEDVKIKQQLDDGLLTCKETKNPNVKKSLLSDEAKLELDGQPTNWRDMLAKTYFCFMGDEKNGEGSNVGTDKNGKIIAIDN